MNLSLTHAIYANVNYIYLKLLSKKEEKIFGPVFFRNSEETKSRKEKNWKIRERKMYQGTIFWYAKTQ